MNWLSVLTALRRIPAAAYALAAGVGLIVALVHGILSYGENRYADGKRDAARGAAFDSTLAATFTRVREVEVVRTDTLIKRVTVTRHRVDTLLMQMPDSVRSLPSVAPLVATVQLLTKQVDSLTLQIDMERAAHTMERSVLEAQNKAAHAVIEVQADSIKQLEKRPTRGTLVKVAGVAVGVGAAAKPLVKLIVEVLR